MPGQRLGYLALLLGAGWYYLAGGEWVSWILLETVLMLPLLSLLLSLPAMAQFTLAPTGAQVLETGDRAELWLLGRCPLPLPPFRGDLRLRNALTGAVCRYDPGQGLPTAHCGSFLVTVEQGRVCDYLGLFSFPIRRTRAMPLTIRPRECSLPDPPAPCSAAVLGRKPDPAAREEERELRPFRPGDRVSRIHWKLSAKTGVLTLAEPAACLHRPLLLSLTLSGTPEQLDEKLGQLRWLGRCLTEQEEFFFLRAATGQGVLTFSVDSLPALTEALDRLLGCRAGPACPLPEAPDFRQYTIGGGPNAP